MKILLATESYWPNADGGALFERRLVQQLNRDGFSTSVWAPGKHIYSYQERDGSYIIYREKSSRLLFNARYRVSFWPFFRAPRIFHYTDPEVVHIHNFAFIGLAALFWAKIKRIPVLATNHFMPENVTLNLPWPGQHRLSRWLVTRYLVLVHNHCNYVTSPTQTGLNILKTTGLMVPAQAVSNGVDTDLFTPRPKPPARLYQKYGLDQQKQTVLYLGRIDGEKRIDIILHAMKLLPDTNTQLVIAGTGNSVAKLKKLTKQLGLGHHVQFTGFIDETDKPALYNLADLFVIASPAELQSIVLLEAMSSGLAVIATDVAALKELCHHGRNGYLFAENDYNQLAGYMQELLIDKARRQHFGAASRQLVLKDHQQNATRKRYEALYTKLARR